MARGPVERRGEPRAAVKLARVATARLPLARRVDQVLVEPPPLGVLLEPRPQARPLAQQRLVRDLERPLIRGHEPAVREGGQRGRSGLVAAGLELVERHATTHERGLLLPGVGQAQQDAPRGGALRLGQPRVGGLGQAADRAAHTAGALVRRAAHHAAVALAPLLEQGGGQQRQAAGLVEHIDDQGVRERRLDPQPDPARRLDDRPAQLVASHRADEHLVRPDEPREPVVRGAAPVEVGAHGDHHLDAPVAVLRQRHERVQEVRPLTLVTADREHLLELVDDKHRLLAALRQHPLERAPADVRQGASAPETNLRSQGALRSRAPAAGPARTAEDFPLPEGPTTASRGEPTSRATSSATSRSRPKKYSA